MAIAQPVKKDTIIVISGDFKPKVADANKYSENPVVNDSAPPVPPLTYSVIQRQNPTAFEVDPIKPAVVKPGETLSKLYRSYFKAGFGNYTTPYFEGWYNTLRKKDYQLGAHYRHLSSTGQIDDVGYSGYSINEASVNYQRYFNKYTLSGDVFFNRNVRHLYGFNPTMLPIGVEVGRDSIRQRFNHIGFNVEGKTNYVTDSSRVNHSFFTRYYNYGALDTVAENRFALGGKGWYNKGEMQYGGMGSFDYIQNRYASADTVSTYLVTLQPFFNLTNKRYSVNAGVNAFLNIQDDSTRFYFHPFIKASFNLYEDYVILYAGIDGNFNRNTLLQFSTDNPFLATNQRIQNSNSKTILTAGLRGAISSSILFNVFGGFKVVDNMALWVNDTLGLRNSFNAVYDTVRVATVGGELTFVQGERFNLATNVTYNSYRPRNEAKAWHMPNLRVALNARYNIQDKIIVKADVFAYNNRFARGFVTDSLGVTTVSPITLKGFADVNLGVEYRYNKQLSAFVQLNNILATRYQWFNQMPQQRFNFMLGIALGL